MFLSNAPQRLCIWFRWEFQLNALRSDEPRVAKIPREKKRQLRCRVIFLETNIQNLVQHI
jgi:hypothetical protein